MAYAGQTLNKPIIVPSLASIPAGPFKRKNISATVTKPPVGPRVPNKKSNPPQPDNPTKLVVSASDIEAWKNHKGAAPAAGKTYLFEGKGEFYVTAIYTATSQEAVDTMTSNTVPLVYYAVGTLKTYDVRAAIAANPAAQVAKERASAKAKADAKEKAKEKAKEDAKARMAAGGTVAPPSSNAPTTRNDRVSAAREASKKAAAEKAKAAGAKSAEKVAKEKACAEGKLRPTIQSVRRDEKSLFNVIIEGDRFKNFDGEEIIVKFIFDDETEEYVEKVAEIVSFSKTEIVTKEEDGTKPSISQQDLTNLKNIIDKTLPAFNPINRTPPTPPPAPTPRVQPAVGSSTNVSPPPTTAYTPTLTTQVSAPSAISKILPTKDISVVTITETTIDTEMLLSGSGSNVEIGNAVVTNVLDSQNLGALSALSSLAKVKLR